MHVNYSKNKIKKMIDINDALLSEDVRCRGKNTANRKIECQLCRACN